MDERVVLPIEDSPERPSNRNAGWEVTFRRGESIGGSSGFEEEPSMT